MIRASVQVRDESRAFSVTVCAENLQRAVEFAAKRYPGLTVGLRFPLDPATFFTEGSCIETETFGLLTEEASAQAVSERAATKRESGMTTAGKGTRLLPPTRKMPEPTAPGRVTTIERRSPG
jgi:hypothetical protein